MLAFDRLPEWDEGRVYGEGVEYTSELNTPKDRYRVGAIAQGIPKKPGDVCCNFEITESLKHEKITYRAWEETKFFGTLSALTTYSLEPVGTDPQFTYELESEWRGFLGDFWQVPRQIVRSQIGRKANTESVREVEKHSGAVNSFTSYPVIADVEI